ncbi:MAG: HldE protein [Chlamydiia bacterium]|nr:HldE protein [Chlamydiia bacterium]
MVDSSFFEKIRPFRALLLGDFLLDTYTTGKVRRISPEGPVPIFEVIHEESRPGGAGNVALNLNALGGEVVTIGRIGEDAEGQVLRELLQQGNVLTEGLFIQPDYRTPVKNRLIAASQQLLRVDQEKIEEVPHLFVNQIKEKILQLIDQVDVIAISDYGKGFLSRSLLAFILTEGRTRGIPVIVDPKGTDFTRYAGATLIKPNCLEAYSAARLSSDATLGEVALQIFQQVQGEWVLITRSEEGMSLFHQSGTQLDFPVRFKEVRDVTGAGDTALAVMCLGLGVGLDLSSSVQLANIAAGIAVERLGCARIALSEIFDRISELSFH